MFNIPCATHKFNRCVNDIFKIKKITEKEEKGTKKYYIFEHNDDGDLRKMEISFEKKRSIEAMNVIKTRVNDILNKCKRLVSTIRHSEVFVRRLKEKQNELNLEIKHKLVQSVDTRWNSIVDMIDSILINQDPIVSMSFEPRSASLKENVLTQAEFAILRDLSALLQPLKVLTYIFSGSLYSTLPHLYPSIYNLINNDLNALEIETHQVQELKVELADSLNKRFKYMFNNDLFIAATFLSYKYKNFHFVEDVNTREELISRAKEYLIGMNIELNVSTVATASLPPTTSSSSRSSTPLSDSNTQIRNGSSNLPSSSSINKKKSGQKYKQKRGREKLNELADKTTEVFHQSPLHIEMQQYQAFVVPPFDDTDEVDPILWFFKTYGNNYPQLSILARCILCITSTSVPAECLFSEAGLIDTDLRNRLNPYNLELLTFLRHNSKYF